MQSIIFVPDLLRRAEHTPRAIFEVLREPILQGCKVDLKYLPDLLDLSNFERLADEENVSGSTLWSRTFYDVGAAAQACFLESIGDCRLVVAFEAAPWLLALCQAQGITCLDIRLSPLRFAADLYWALRINDRDHYARIHAHAVFAEELRLESALLAANVRHHQARLAYCGRKDEPLGRSLIFIGQAPYDASLLSRDAKILQLNDFAEQIRDALHGRKLYYKPHPMAPHHAEQERIALQALAGVPVPVCHLNAYQILASTEDVELIGISSGLLQESRWFAKTAHTLYQPFVPLAIDEPDANDRYQQVHYQTLVAPAFWHQLLTPLTPPPRLSRLTSGHRNLARETFDAWWDYGKVMTWERSLPVESFERSGGGLLRARLQVLEQRVEELEGWHLLDKPAG